MQPFEDIRVERDGPVTLIRIARPQSRNALRRKTLDELIDAFGGASASGTRAIVISGDGAAFASGADLKEMRASTTAEKEENLERRWGPLLKLIEEGPIPVIASIQGYAVAGGLEIALACHLRIAGQSANLGLTEILRGHIPGGGGTVRLPRLVGVGHALRYLLTGDTVSADEARRIGLVNEVLPDEQALPRAMAIAQSIARLSPTAVRLTLRAVMSQRELGLDDALALERELCKEMRASRDYQEGLDAFVAKREPRYGQ